MMHGKSSLCCINHQQNPVELFFILSWSVLTISNYFQHMCGLSSCFTYHISINSIIFEIMALYFLHNTQMLNLEVTCLFVNRAVLSDVHWGYGVRESTFSLFLTYNLIVVCRAVTIFLLAQKSMLGTHFFELWLQRSISMHKKCLEMTFSHERILDFHAYWPLCFRKLPKNLSGHLDFFVSCSVHSQLSVAVFTASRSYLGTQECLAK